MNRHADLVTIDYIIELRRRLAETERQRDNALSGVWKLRMDNERFREALQKIVEFEGGKVFDVLHELHSIAIEALEANDGHH